MKISVLMLSYNHANYINSAVLSAINQESKNCKIEIDILDDGSNDGTKEILVSLQSKFPKNIRLFLKPHEGLGAVSKNFNFLIKEAKGDYIAFLASDDEYSLNRFSKQLEIFKSDNDVAIIYADGQNKRNNKKMEKLTTGESLWALESNDPSICYQHTLSSAPLIWIQSALVRSDFIKSTTYFDEEMIADDWIFNINVFKNLLKKNLKYYFINEIVFFRNIHNANTSSNSKVHYYRVKQVTEKYINLVHSRNILSDCCLNFLIKATKEKKIKLIIFFLIQYFRYDLKASLLRGLVKKKLKKY